MPSVTHEGFSQPPPNFENQKRAFFSALSLRVMPALRLHKDQGLWERRENPEGKLQRDWGNVTEHCLVEAARVEEFARLLKLPDDLREDMVTAATLHDFYKKEEITKLRANNTSWEAYSQAGSESRAIIAGSAFSDRVGFLASAAGHETVPLAEVLSIKPELTGDEIAWLVMHYVDDYTIDSNWVSPVSQSADGQQINDFDRRMENNKRNAVPGGKYYGVNQAGVEHFGEPTYDAQQRVGYMVEDRLALLINERSATQLDPKFLPEFIDHQVTDTILYQAA